MRIAELHQESEFAAASSIIRIHGRKVIMRAKETELRLASDNPRPSDGLTPYSPVWLSSVDGLLEDGFGTASSLLTFSEEAKLSDRLAFSAVIIS